MPIYEYKCTKCDETFEEFQNVNEGNEKLNCPKCGEPKPEKIFSAFAATGSNKDGFSSQSCAPSGFS